jgi:hypothetical protein
MSEPARSIFVPQYLGEGDWQIQAQCPESVIKYIIGFKSEAEALAWIGGSQSRDWLRKQGYPED